MKKNLAMLLAVPLILGTATTALASPSSSPFTDVPANHWAYGAVKQLVKDGVLDNGYGDGTFRGDRTITRYEMAIIVGKAMTKEDQLSAADKALVTKLSTEFANELTNLGVRVTALEKNSSTLKISGFDQQRYQENDSLTGLTNHTTGATVKNAYRINNNVKLNVSGDVNDNMSFFAGAYMRIQDTDANDGDFTREGDLGFYNAYVNMKNVLPASNLQLGRLHVNLANGMMFGGDYFDGGQLMFGGDKLKGTVGYGDYTYMPGPDFLGYANVTGATSSSVTTTTGSGNGATNSTNTPVKANIAQLQYVLSKNTSVYAAYMASANNDVDYNYLYKDTDFGFTSNITPNLQWVGEYARNNSDTVSSLASGDTTAWFTGVKLGNADMKKPGTSDFYVRYLKRGAAAIDWRASYCTFSAMYKIGTNIEGPIVGYDLAVAKNVTMNLDYEKYHTYSTTTNNPGDINYGAFYQLVFNFSI